MKFTVALCLCVAPTLFAADADRIYYLTLAGGGRVLSARTDGSDLKTLATAKVSGPDGIVVDAAAGHIYWTDMGNVSANDGAVERADLDGSNMKIIVPAGGTFTPKQLKLDSARGKLYWSDREGMRILRANLDGTGIEVLVEAAKGEEARKDARNWCVGIALDVARNQMYWTQKGDGGNGRIFRANLDGSHIEMLFDHLPEPIDMDLDLGARMMYWTDRGDPPRGNNVSRAPMDSPKPDSQQILFGDLKEGIGLAIDVPHNRMFVTDLGGNVYTANLDGSNHHTILTGQGMLTGIALGGK